MPVTLRNLEAMVEGRYRQNRCEGRVRRQSDGKGRRGDQLAEEQAGTSRKQTGGTVPGSYSRWRTAT